MVNSRLVLVDPIIPTGISVVPDGFGSWFPLCE
jgi:hypothetical protein